MARNLKIRNSVLIRGPAPVNWTRQLSCRVINSLGKYSLGPWGSLHIPMRIDKQSPVYMEFRLESFVSGSFLRREPRGRAWPAAPAPRPHPPPTLPV